MHTYKLYKLQYVMYHLSTYSCVVRRILFLKLHHIILSLTREVFKYRTTITRLAYLRVYTVLFLSPKVFMFLYYGTTFKH